nr:MAG TPA: hypothetical protein [Bacteriophage sp.]
MVYNEYVNKERELQSGSKGKLKWKLQNMFMRT